MGSTPSAAASSRIFRPSCGPHAPSAQISARPACIPSPRSSGILARTKCTLCLIIVSSSRRPVFQRARPRSSCKGKSKNQNAQKCLRNNRSRTRQTRRRGLFRKAAIAHKLSRNGGGDFMEQKRGRCGRRCVLALALVLFAAAAGLSRRTLPRHYDPNVRQSAQSPPNLPALRFLTVADYPPFNYRDPSRGVGRIQCRSGRGDLQRPVDELHSAGLAMGSGR